MMDISYEARSQSVRQVIQQHSQSPQNQENSDSKYLSAIKLSDFTLCFEKGTNKNLKEGKINKTDSSLHLDKRTFELFDHSSCKKAIKNEEIVLQEELENYEQALVTIPRALDEKLNHKQYSLINETYLLNYPSIFYQDKSKLQKLYFEYIFKY
ncbi:cation channel family protein, putative (macronuclear) [Tetrahymena thermophila SB210]|uniref:Cation channel family protein, putative n=1 Tax=Tetrahymena thermophila (strain SB210) TaxID=312017 RepID=W7XKK4_TETTS|nr:cation channel family protein, putative [Tetrahymena thermophila SB210]EWS74974.1 cation channel family protein, putative [Tetrahymena thermophila SB210]|eukprot:XP_012652515.1 cation channel family protein, putative [Tetrahymena thermophila SB210]